MFSLVLMPAVYKLGWRNKNSNILELGSDSGCLPSVVGEQLISKCSGSGLLNPTQRIKPIFGSILCVLP